MIGLVPRDDRTLPSGLFTTLRQRTRAQLERIGVNRFIIVASVSKQICLVPLDVTLRRRYNGVLV